MKTLAISTTNEKMWTILLVFVQQHSFDIHATKVEETAEAETENYVLHLAQNPEEIYA